MRLGSIVCGLLISIIYLMDFLCLQRGLESRPWILSTFYLSTFFVSFVCQFIGEVPPPLLHAIDNSILLLLLCTSSIFKDTLYFLLKYVLPPVLFTLTQVVLLLIASTFTRVQIQSNLGTTEYIPRLSTGL
jgi:hypothetical protein